MKIQYILFAFLTAFLCFAAGFWLGPQYAIAPTPYFLAMRESDPALYRSRQTSVDVVLAGDASKVRDALLHSDLLVRTAKLGSLLSELGPDSLDDVRQAFDTVFLDLGDTELVIFAEWWARFDPHAAMDWSESEWRADHGAVRLQIMRTWGRIDPRGALVRAELGRGNKQADKASYFLAVIAGWEQSDQLGALAYLQAMGPGIQRQRMMVGFARRRVLRYGIDDAFKFILSLPDSDKLFKLNLMRRLVSSAVRVDAQQTASLSATLQGGPYFQGIPQRIAIRWVRKDPQATIQWLESLEDSDSRDDGVRETYRSWAAYDQEDAANWVMGTEHVPWRDHALAIHARHMQLGDFEEAIAAAEKIFDDELRQATLTMIVRVWGKNDPEAAGKYVDNADWTENERNRALARGWRRRAMANAQIEKEMGIHPKQVREKMERNLVESELDERFDNPIDKNQGSENQQQPW